MVDPIAITIEKYKYSGLLPPLPLRAVFKRRKAIKGIAKRAVRVKIFHLHSPFFSISFYRSPLYIPSIPAVGIIRRLGSALFCLRRSVMRQTHGNGRPLPKCTLERDGSAENGCCVLNY